MHECVCTCLADGERIISGCYFSNQIMVQQISISPNILIIPNSHWYRPPVTLPFHPRMSIRLLDRLQDVNRGLDNQELGIA